MWFLCLCKLTKVFTIVLVLNRSPSGSTCQLSLVHLFVSLSPPVSPSMFLYFDTELLYLAWIIDVLHRCFPPCRPPLSLSSAFFYTTPSCVSARLAVIPVPVSSLLLFQFISSSSFLPDDSLPPFLLCLPSSPQPIVGLLPPPPFFSLPFPL